MSNILRRVGSLLEKKEVLRSKYVMMFAVLSFIVAPMVFASGGAESGHSAASTFLWIAVILIVAKVSGLVEKIGQPSVLGELVIGVILGNLGLIGIHLFDPIMQDPIIRFLSELGVVILLFQIGLESNITEMKKVGARAGVVAIVGVVAPFVLGTYVVGPMLLPGLDSSAYLFLGAALTATSVGITARVFQELGKLKTKEAQIVLGAAVIDDVLGLIILAVVSAIATLGAVSFGMVGMIAAKAILFLVGAIILGQLLAPKLGKAFSMIHAGVGMKFTLAISFGLILAYLASYFGLASIVGAFAAGLILDPVHFKYFKDPKVVNDIKEALEDEKDAKLKQKLADVMHKHSHSHIEDIVAPLALFLVPIFFVVTGMSVNLETLKDPKIVMVSLAITAVAVVGKLVAGFFGGKGVNKVLIGFGMVPRGEVGLIFASIGMGIGVISDEVFSIIVIMVILTTLITPPILAAIIKKAK